jgi:hypothetical protein
VKSFPAFGILFGSRDRLPALRALLEKHSGLPGPRANLELAFSFAASVARMKIADWQWSFLVGAGSTSADKAPRDTVKEYVPVCAILAIGALYGTGLPRPRRRAALALLSTAAEDPRWRIREAVALALQQVGERNTGALREIVAGWLPGASFLLMRAIAAGLAHPPLLAEPEFASFGVETAQRVVSAFTRADARARRSEPYRVLKQGLAYALSVFAAAAPGPGFALLRKAAAVRDPDLAWVVRENLKKKRISGAFPKECADVALLAARAAER